MPCFFVTSKKTEYDTSKARQLSESGGNMMSEPKIEAEKGAFRFPALVSLAPKRRFKANPPANEETMQLDEETPRPLHRQRLKRSGRVILRWPSAAPDFAQIASASVTVRSYAP